MPTSPNVNCLLGESIDANALPSPTLMKLATSAGAPALLLWPGGQWDVVHSTAQAASSTPSAGGSSPDTYVAPAAQRSADGFTTSSRFVSNDMLHSTLPAAVVPATAAPLTRFGVKLNLLREAFNLTPQEHAATVRLAFAEPVNFLDNTKGLLLGSHTHSPSETQPFLETALACPPEPSLPSHSEASGACRDSEANAEHGVRSWGQLVCVGAGRVVSRREAAATLAQPPRSPLPLRPWEAANRACVGGEPSLALAHRSSSMVMAQAGAAASTSERGDPSAVGERRVSSRAVKRPKTSRFDGTGREGAASNSRALLPSSGNRMLFKLNCSLLYDLDTTPATEAVAAAGGSPPASTANCSGNGIRSVLQPSSAVSTSSRHGSGRNSAEFAELEPQIVAGCRACGKRRPQAGVGSSRGSCRHASGHGHSFCATHATELQWLPKICDLPDGLSDLINAGLCLDCAHHQLLLPPPQHYPTLLSEPLCKQVLKYGVPLIQPWLKAEAAGLTAILDKVRLYVCIGLLHASGSQENR